MRGSVLLLSLWTTAALAVLAIGQATRVSLQLKWVSRMQESDRALYLAWAGVETAAHLLNSDTNPWDAPSEVWGQRPTQAIPFEKGTFTYQIFDEQARIPLNSASVAILNRLPGFTPEVSQRWVAARSDSAQPKWAAHLGELPALIGSDFNPKILSELEALVTVHATGPVNINTAAPQVLERLGLSSALAQRIGEFRAGRDQKEGTADDKIFSDVGQIQPILEEVAGPLLDKDKLILADLISQQQLGVGSSFFRVEVEGGVGPAGIHKKVTAILERDFGGSAPKVRGWHET